MSVQGGVILGFWSYTDHLHTMVYHQKATDESKWMCVCGFTEKPPRWNLKQTTPDRYRAVCPECNETYPIVGPLDTLGL